MGMPAEMCPETDPRSLITRQPVILVADGEVMIRNLVRLLLQANGYVVLSASDGQEGLELSRRYPGTIELVITDVDMPRLNGMDLCAHLLEERPGIKAVVMSGEDTSEIIRQNINLPFLLKPFDGEALLARVRNVLGASPPSTKREEVMSIRWKVLDSLETERIRIKHVEYRFQVEPPGGRQPARPQRNRRHGYQCRSPCCTSRSGC